MVHRLPKELNGGLRTIPVQLWHIQVVDKDSATLPYRWTINSFAAFVELAIDDILVLDKQQRWTRNKMYSNAGIHMGYKRGVVMLAHHRPFPLDYPVPVWVARAVCPGRVFLSSWFFGTTVPDDALALPLNR